MAPTLVQFFFLFVSSLLLLFNRKDIYTVFMRTVNQTGYFTLCMSSMVSLSSSSLCALLFSLEFLNILNGMDTNRKWQMENAMENKQHKLKSSVAAVVCQCEIGE